MFKIYVFEHKTNLSEAKEKKYLSDTSLSDYKSRSHYINSFCINYVTDILY